MPIYDQDDGDVQGELFAPHKRTRTGDPETSLEAAESVTDITGKQGAVLKCLMRFGPATDTTTNRVYNGSRTLFDWPMQSDSGLRARRSELVTLGLVRWNGDRETLPSGRGARVWESI